MTGGAVGGALDEAGSGFLRLTPCWRSSHFELIDHNVHLTKGGMDIAQDGYRADSMCSVST